MLASGAAALYGIWLAHDLLDRHYLSATVIILGASMNFLLLACNFAQDDGRNDVHPPARCHAYEYIIKDWLAKNRVIHRLERRICQLKRANRNLREQCKPADRGQA